MKYTLLLLSFFLISCSKAKTVSISTNICEPQKTEPAYCSNVSLPNDPVTISGSARYRKRNLIPSGLGAVSDPQIIRFAEVAVLDSNGNVIQCGETDSNGDFSINIERTNGNVLVEVRSRAFNSEVKASILNNHLDMTYHFIRSSAVPGNVNQSVGTITAPATDSLEGGAFHILDLIYKANEFLRTTTNNCNMSFADCPPVSVLDKVQVFWQKGFNPGVCVGNAADNTVSYYIAGTSRMYIVGGVGDNVATAAYEGDTDSSDTDHFDDHIVLHEYAHFIEDIVSISDSPGGEHNANSLIDPRLAWSEAWASYFAAQVTGIPVYQDTRGNISGITSNLVYYNMETNTPARDPSPGGGYVQLDGEGSFREFAILRALTDATDLDADDVDSDGIEADFIEFWTILAGNNGFKNPNIKFRFAGKFFSLHDNLAGRTDIKSLLVDEKIYDPVTSDFLDHYATPDNGDGCGNIPITPGNNNDPDKHEDGRFENSNPFSSNDFYEYTHSGGNINIALSHDGNQDLDLYLYSSDYIYGNSNFLIAKSDATTGTTENINQSLSAGTYMVNVKVFPKFSGSTLDTTTANYSLFINSNRICP